MRWSRWIAPLLAVGIGIAGLAALHRQLGAFSYHQVLGATRLIPGESLLLAAALTVVGYLMFASYDLLALRYVGAQVPPGRALFAGFMGCAISQNVGFASVAGASLRVRFWSAWGLSTLQIAQGVAFTVVTFWLGVLSVGGATLLVGLDPAAVHASWIPLLRLTGALLLATVLAYLGWASVGRRPLTIREWTFAPPGWRLAAAQLIASTLDWLLAALVLYLLLPRAAGGALPHFIGIFLVAQLAGLLSHIPGGLGVFDSLLLVLLGSSVHAGAIAGSLLVFRATYYLVPFLLALGSFLASEVLLRRAAFSRALRLAGSWIPLIAPPVLAAATFAAGIVLLVSGATPSLHHRLRMLNQVLPLGILELSHFMASIAGIALVLLSRGMRQRLDAAWHLTIVVLCIGIVTSLLKGFDYEEATLLAIALAAILPARRSFFRRAALFAEPLTPAWIAAVILVLAGTTWLGLFSYKHVDYSSELWWHFALRADAPRFLRATVGAAVFALVVATWHLIRPARLRQASPTPEELARTRQFIDASSQAASNLALLGDKALLFGERGGFVMYGVEGRSWIALGDPVAASEGERAELAWRFREEAVRQGARPVFYQVSREHLSIYVELGLTLLKLGECAVVPLEDWSMDGSERKKLRRSVREAEKAGCTFEMHPAGADRGLLGELRAVSDAWLASKRTREKGFSLGRFREDYLANFPIAVVRQGERIVAFANVLETRSRAEVSVDLMRHVPDAPSGTMDFLFTHLMEWARATGFERFDLGMAPLSGFQPRAMAPSWNRLGRAVFRLGEHFYNFEGLRRYKEKFRPVWEPRYLAAPGGLQLPMVLTNVATLISGGVKGVISR